MDRKSNILCFSERDLSNGIIKVDIREIQYTLVNPVTPGTMQLGQNSEVAVAQEIAVA